MSDAKYYIAEVLTDFEATTNRFQGKDSVPWRDLSQEEKDKRINKVEEAYPLLPPFPPFDMDIQRLAHILVPVLLTGSPPKEDSDRNLSEAELDELTKPEPPKPRMTLE